MSLKRLMYVINVSKTSYYVLSTAIQKARSLTQRFFIYHFFSLHFQVKFCCLNDIQFIFAGDVYGRSFDHGKRIFISTLSFFYPFAKMIN